MARVLVDMKLTGALLAVTLLALGAAPGALAAPPRLERLSGASGPPSADGSRYALTPLAGGRYRLSDDWIGTSTVITAPAGCSYGTPKSGYLLLRCGRPKLLAIATGNTYDIAGFDALVEGRGPPPDGEEITSIDGIGRTRVSVSFSSSRYSVGFLLNWRTGALQSYPELGSHSVIDLDGNAPVSRLCRPLARRLNLARDDYLAGARYLGYEYERPYGIAETATGFAIDRCGSRRPVRTVRASGADFGGGTVTWISEDPTTWVRSLNVLKLRKNRVTRRRLGFVGWEYGVVVDHTARWVYISRYAGGPEPNGHWVVYRMAMPR